MNPRWLHYQIHGVFPARKAPRRPRRGPVRSWKYRAWVRSLPCCACGTTREIEAAHTAKDGGLSQKASDLSVVPLCHDCHQSAPSAYHRIGRERFERLNNLDLTALVRRLNSLWFQFSREVK